jgi:Kef-type K+ transport system membrane component KefB
LGNIPGFTDFLFPASSIASLSLVSSYGIVLFMFIVGLDQDMGLWKKSARTTVITEILVIGGCLLGSLPFSFATDSPDYHTTSLGIYIGFVGVLCAISALPVLARIIAEFNFLHTPLGMFTMSAAAIDDLIAWPCLALLTTLASSKNQISLLYTLLLFVGEALFILLVIGPFLRLCVRRYGMHKGFSDTMGSIVLMVLLLIMFISEMIG